MAQGDIDYVGRLQIPEGTSDEDASVIRATYSYREEAYVSKRDRMVQNRINYDSYNLKGDFTHKKRGQSREYLPKQALAVEQISSFFHQAMLDVGEWYGVDYAPGIKKLKVEPNDIKKLMGRQLDKIHFDEKIEDLLKLGLLGSLAIAKVHGEYVNRPVFYTQQRLGEDDKMRSTIYRADKRAWQLRVDPIRQEDFFPDPTGDGLFIIHQIEMDLQKVKELSRGPNAIYDEEVVNQITGGFEDMEQVARKARETAQNQTFTTYRKRVRLWEGWGTIIDPASGEVIHKDATWTVANDRYLIQRPRPYPFWHGSHPFIFTPIIRTPHGVWHKALMDAPTMLNIAQNESFNLALDAGIMAAWGIRQLRTEWLADETKVADGIPAGETLEVNSMCPPGQKVLESVQTGTLSPEFFQMYNILGNEFNQAAITNDLRMGQVPDRQVKATEVVEASQSITSMFTGISRVLEQNLIVALLEKIWMTMAQNMDDLDQEEVVALLGKDRAMELSALSPEDRFKETANGYKFKVFGVSLILNKIKDFKKLTSLLQTIAANQPLTEEFIKKYDFGKVLEELMKSLDIDLDRLEIDPVEQEAMKKMQAGGAGSTPAGPNAQSQIAPVANMGGEGNPGGPQPNEGEGQIPQAKFPPSRASNG
jgi:hypothetical protein